MRPWVSRGLSFLLPCLGMIVGYLVAERLHATPLARAPIGPAGAALEVQSLRLVDEAGRPRILLGMSGEGSPAIWFFDAHGKARLNLGLYADGNAFVVLNDGREEAVEILRSVGEGAAPVLVQKARGRDRLVLGLDGSTGVSFLVRHGESGAIQRVFGQD